MMPLVANIWTAVVVVTLLALTIGGIGVAVAAFKRHFVWGLAVLFLPFCVPAFALLHWDRARRPFLLAAGATAALVVELLVTRLVQIFVG